MDIPSNRSYLKVNGHQPLLKKTVGDIIDDSGMKFGNKLALIAPSVTETQNVSKTFSELKLEVKLYTNKNKVIIFIDIMVNINQLHFIPI